MSKTIDTRPAGPTRNLAYNALLVKWSKAAGGLEFLPSCEECEADLTGKAVHDIGWGWVCDVCVMTLTDAET